MADGGEDVVEIFTGGVCWGSPGPGGWGALLRSGHGEGEIFGGEPATTGNRMELMAVVCALEELSRRAAVRLSTDSEYVVLGVSRSLPQWRVDGSLTGDGQAVVDVDLWRRLDELIQEHDIDWLWRRGVGDDLEHDRVSRLAVRGAGEGVAGGPDSGRSARTGSRMSAGGWLHELLSSLIPRW
ncbi:RNase H family protein [Nocardia wallacei]|uniref:RNase H family protein n=1 Tax=Nocardia wallacei TaxID=480035 RepID=UPI00245465D9|nr:RNase H family protein [Nocardia wallacei]